MLHSNAFAIFLSLVFVAVGFSQDETKEPLQSFQLQVDGKSQTVKLDEEFELDLSGKTKFKLTALNTRQFKFAGLHFPYPTSFAFEAEIDPDLKLWTLDGSDCLIMVFAFPGEKSTGHDDFAKSIGSQYGNGTSYSKVELACQGFTLKGTQISAEVVGAKLIQQVFEIPTSDGKRMLLIQDSLEDGGTNSKEFQGVVKQLKQEMKISRESISAKQ